MSYKFISVIQSFLRSWKLKRRKGIIKLQSFIQIITLYHRFKPSQIGSSLSTFYDQVNEKWTDTRVRSRPEFEFIVSYIKTIIGHPDRTKNNKQLTIVELGCGDGRFAHYLTEHLGDSFLYIGVDCSSKLIDTAKKRALGDSISFIVWDMNYYISFLEQQSVDIVVSIASIQHLHRTKRKLIWHQIHRVLNYWWAYITINRSYSQWMWTKHRPSILSWWILMMINHRTFSWNDSMIPFKESKHLVVQSRQHNRDSRHEWWLRFQPVNIKHTLKADHYTSIMLTHYRFYHFFTLWELKNLTKKSGLVVWQLWYMSDKGQYTNDRRSSRNTLLIASKEL